MFSGWLARRSADCVGLGSGMAEVAVYGTDWYSVGMGSGAVVDWGAGLGYWEEDRFGGAGF